MAIRSVKKAQQPTPQAEASGNDLRRKISEVAYYRAQQRGFSPGYELEDWLAAEAQVKRGAAPAP